MKTPLALAAVLAIATGISAIAADKPDPPGKRKAYKAPVGAENGVRVNGVSRASNVLDAKVFVLAPDHVGLTLRSQPDLFWFQTSKAETRFELIVTQINKPEPILSVSGVQPAEGGIARMDLGKHKIKLKKGVEYQWSVALIADPKKRSLDTVASGYLKREVPDPQMSTRLARKTPDQLVDVYADSGIWYDALETLSDMIDARPKDKSLREWRADLLDQVGLPEAADFDREVAQKIGQ
jgi:hypothetical protein